MQASRKKRLSSAMLSVGGGRQRAAVEDSTGVGGKEL